MAGINFTVTDSPREPTIRLQNHESAIMQAMANQMNIAVDVVTDRVFIQRDVRGMNRDSFYIVKPNELKNWHKAIALVDIADFMATMVKGSEV